MSRIPNPVAQRLMAEGLQADNDIVHETEMSEAMKMVREMPTNSIDREIYVGKLLRETLEGKRDKQAFKIFANLTHIYDELIKTAPRAKQLAGRR